MRVMRTVEWTSSSSRRWAALAVALSLAATVTAGCAWHEPARVEKDFGKSVRQMVQAQIHDPQTAAAPAVDGPDLLDGTTADITVDGYRSAAGEARVFRQQQSNNPVPVTGKGPGVEAESEE